MSGIVYIMLIDDKQLLLLCANENGRIVEPSKRPAGLRLYSVPSDGIQNFKNRFYFELYLLLTGSLIFITKV